MSANKPRSGNRSIMYHCRRGTEVSVTILMIISALTFMTLAGCSKHSDNIEKSAVPSFGVGSCELIIFTDYFCPSCQTLESELDPLLNKLVKTGGVKITFVDAPVHKVTQIYAKYFLYAVNAGKDFDDIMHTRRVLFSIAKTGTVDTEEYLALELKKQHVAFQPYDLRKVYVALNGMMKTHDIRSTPTCVVKYSAVDIRKYSEPEDIKRALLSLLRTQTPCK